MALFAGASATRFGMMNGVFDEGLPIESSTRPNGSFSTSWKVLSSILFHSFVAAASAWPIASFFDQRVSEAMASSEVTGAPSCHFKPSRSVNVQVSLSALVSYFSTICGWIFCCSSMANSVS